MYCQVRPGDEPLAAVLDRLAIDANAIAPGLGRERARRIAESLLRPHVTQTTSCGRVAGCDLLGAALWGTASPVAGAARPSCLEVDDPHDLANRFAELAVESLSAVGDDRDRLAEGLAGVFRLVLGPVVFATEACGRLTECSAPTCDPFGAVPYVPC